MTPQMAKNNVEARKRKTPTYLTLQTDTQDCASSKRRTLAALSERTRELETTVLKQAVLLANVEAKYELLSKLPETVLENGKVNAAIIAQLDAFKKQQSSKKKATNQNLIMSKLREALTRYRKVPGGIYTVPKGSILTDECIKEEIQKLFVQVQVCVTM
jgi:hypothetical protein